MGCLVVVFFALSVDCSCIFLNQTSSCVEISQIFLLPYSLIFNSQLFWVKVTKDPEPIPRTLSMMRTHTHTRSLLGQFTVPYSPCSMFLGCTQKVTWADYWTWPRRPGYACTTITPLNLMFSKLLQDAGFVLTLNLGPRVSFWVGAVTWQLQGPRISWALGSFTCSPAQVFFGFSGFLPSSKNFINGTLWWFPRYPIVSSVRTVVKNNALCIKTFTVLNMNYTQYILYFSTLILSVGK